MSDYGVGEFFKKNFEMQQNMTKAWMDMMAPTSGLGGATAEQANPFAAMTELYKNVYESWQKQFIDSPWAKMTPWSYNMFNTENTGFDMFNKMMNSGKNLNNLSAIWQQLIDKAPLENRDAILKFIEENKATFEKLSQDFLKPFVPEAMRPLMDNVMGLLKEYEGIGKDLFKPWMELQNATADDFKKIMQGDTTAYSSFYKTINAAYESSFGKLFNMAGFGLTKEQNEELMGQFDAFFKMFIAMSEMMALIADVSKENMVAVIETYQNRVKDGKQPQSLKEFYDLWVKINEDAFVKVFGTPQFSQIFCNFAQKSCEFKVHLDKVLEQMLGWAPFPKNSDMASLYKTVYDLRKSDYKNTQQLKAVQEELAALKAAQPKGDK